MSYIAVIGAGSWGTTLAVLLAGKGHDVSLWAYEKDLAAAIDETRVNSVYLPGVEVPDNIKVSSDLEAVFKDCRFVICAVPTPHIRGVFGEAAGFIHGIDKVSFISAAKGIENETLKRPSQIIFELTGRQASVLSGPSFAKETAVGMPTAITLASADKSEAILLQELLSSGCFRVYTHEDVIGVELGGAIKNVIAIASGISDGLGLGHNSRAALITRGLAEMRRLGVAMGALEHTFSGLSGIGDLVLTCTANLSRNYSFGLKLAQGLSADEITSSSRFVAEGVKTSKSVAELARIHRVEMPISEQIHRVVFEGKSPLEAVQELMARSPKKEFYG